MEDAATLTVDCRTARYAELLRSLCAIVAELLDAQLEERTCNQCAQVMKDVDRERSELVDKELTLPMILAEFALTPRQVLLLRRRGGFPSPHRRRGSLTFWRSDVERWIADQPNPTRPADILRRQKGNPIRRVGSRHSAAIIPLKASMIAT